MSSELGTMIEGLGSADARRRECEAARIYLLGETAACSACMKWWEDEELNGLICGEGRKVTVGVAVGRETFAKIRAANEMPRLAEVPSDQDAEEFELHLSGGMSLDILTSRAPGGEGAIARYLAKFGEGIQQVEFRCKDVGRATEILRDRLGLQAIYPATRPGADGTRINFFLVTGEDGGKVLIELYEPRG
jgi:hypothetical protein